MKVSFLLALATAKRVGELQALSCRVAYHGPDLSLAYLPEFVAKGLKATNERQDDGAGILHQVALFPIDQVYFIYTVYKTPT